MKVQKGPVAFSVHHAADLSSLSTNNAAMASWALRLSAVTALAYVPIVISGEECRRRSCVVFTDAPEDCKSVASVLQKECQPICCREGSQAAVVS